MFIQKFKKSIFNLLVLGQLVTPLSAYAGGSPRDNDPSTKDEILVKSGDLLIHALNRYSDDINMKWAKGEFKTQSEGVGFDIKAFTVIKEYAQQVFFTQYGLSKDTDGSTLNVGLGFNHLMPRAISSTNLAVGGNIFYDAKTGSESILNPFGEGVHKRFSVGGTIMTSQAGVFFNIYKGLSEGIEGSKASDGYDFGVNGLVPGYESINLGVTQYDFNDENKGSKFKIEYKPNSFFTFGAEQDQSDTPSTSVYIETKYKFNTPFEEQLAPIASASNDVWSKRYDEVERDNTITLETLETAEKGVTVVLVEALTAEWGVTIQIPTPVGGGEGEITYDIKKDDIKQNALQQNTAEEEIEEEKIVVSDTGVVSGATKPQTVVVIVSRASDGDYSASSLDVEVTFIKKDPDLDLDEGSITLKMWGEDIVIPEPTSNPDATGAFDYKIKEDLNNTGAKILVEDDTPGAKLVDAKGAGTVIVTVTRAADELYAESTVEITIEIKKKTDSITLPADITAVWGTDIDLKSLVTTTGTGDITLEVLNDDGITYNVTTGQINATQSGTSQVKITRLADANFESVSKTVNIEFTRQNTSIEVNQPAPVEMGVLIKLADSITTNGTYTYTLIVGENLAEATLDTATGVLSNAKKGATVGVTVTRAEDKKYFETSKEVTVEFKKSNASVETKTTLPAQNDWKSSFTLKDYIQGGGEGTLEFRLDSTSPNTATVDLATGAITELTGTGVVKVKVSRGISDTHNASEIVVDINFIKVTPIFTVASDIPTVPYGGAGINLADNITLRDPIRGHKITKQSVRYETTNPDVSIDDNGVATATKGTTAVINIKSPQNVNYLEAVGTMTITFDNHNLEMTITAPTTGEWGTDASLAGSTTVADTDIIGAAITTDGNYTYKIESPVEGITVDEISGNVTAANSGQVGVIVTRTGDTHYKEVSKTIQLTFNRKALALNATSIPDQGWKAPYDITSYVSSTAATTTPTGAVTYAKTNNTDTHFDIDNNGVITAKSPGAVNVTATRAQDKWYFEASKEVTVNFVQEDGSISLDGPLPKTPWATGIDISAYVNSTDGAGDVVYTITGDNTIGASFEGSYLTATNIGFVKVKVSQAGSTNYNLAQDSKSIQFKRQPLIIEVSPSLPTSTQQGAAPLSLSEYISAKISADTAEVTGGTYIFTAPDSNDYTVTSGGEITSNIVGDITVTVTRELDTLYAKSTKDFIVTFGKADGSVTLAPVTKAPWSATGIDISKIVTAAGTGELQYNITSTNTANASFEGTMLKATQSGNVEITVKQITDNNVKGATSTPLTIEFGRKPLELTVGTLPTQVAGNDALSLKEYVTAISDNTDVTKFAAADGNTIVSDTITFEAKNVSDDYKVTEAGNITSDIAGDIAVIVKRVRDDKYAVAEHEFTVTFTVGTPDLTVESDIASVPYGGAGINLRGQITLKRPDGTRMDKKRMRFSTTNPDITINQIDAIATATKGTTAIINVTSPANAGYVEINTTMTITFDNHDLEMTITPPTTGKWGTDVSLAGTATVADTVIIGAAITTTGNYTYKIESPVDGITVDEISGNVTAVNSGQANVIITRAADTHYNEVSETIPVTFNTQPLALNATTIDSPKWTADYDVSVHVSSTDAIIKPIGAMTYAKKINADTHFDITAAGVIKPQRAGEVSVTATRAKDKWYSEAIKDLTVTFDKGIVTLTVGDIPTQPWSEDGFDISAFINANNSYPGPYKYTITGDTANASTEGNILKTTQKGTATIAIEVDTNDWQTASTIYKTITTDRKDSSVQLPTGFSTITLSTPAANSTTHNYKAIAEIVTNNIHNQVVIVTGDISAVITDAEVADKIASSTNCFRTATNFYVKKGETCDLTIKVEKTDKYKVKTANFMLDAPL